MYIIWFLHRVPAANAARFAVCVERANAVFRRHGGLGHTLYEMADPAPKYGCSAVADCVEVAPDEVLYAEVDYFRDRAHYDEVMPLVDADPELEELYQELIGLLNIARIARGEFHTVSEVVDGRPPVLIGPPVPIPLP